jgi:hypothetical protein
LKEILLWNGVKRKVLESGKKESLKFFPERRQIMFEFIATFVVVVLVYKILDIAIGEIIGK